MLSINKSDRRYLVATLLVLLITISAYVWRLIPTPEQAMREFYSNEGPEDTLMDPLILAGDDVVPLVIERVKDKDMPMRRYAIGFLGNGSYRQALPILENILQDTSEIDYFRSDALHAIYQIDQAMGLKYAALYKDMPGDLGFVSRDLLSSKKLLPDHRTYLDALIGKHD